MNFEINLGFENQFIYRYFIYRWYLLYESEKLVRKDRLHLRLFNLFSKLIYNFCL